MRIPGGKRRGARLAAVAMVVSLFVGSAWAQVEDIVVTARKKEENLQDVPISVTAFGQQDIERKGINRIGDVAKFSTSVQFDESFAQSDTRVTIRGLSPTRGRQNLAFLVDGIDLSSEAITSSGGSLLINTRLLDVQRIEIVKGPQVALYGRAAFNGAIQYVTKKPSDEFEAEIRTDINNEDQYSLTGSISGPVLGDLLGVRLNAAVWDEEGFYTNRLTGGSVGDQEGIGVALSTRSIFGNGLTVNLRAEYTADEGRPSPQTYLPFNTVADVPATAGDEPGQADLAQCYTDFINVISDPTQPLGEGAGNDVRLVERARRIIDPALAASLGFPDPATATPADYRAFVQANPFLSPYCEDRVLTYTGALPDGDDVRIRQGTNPLTPGEDYEGFDRDLWRLALTAEWQLSRGAFNLWAGFLRDDNSETQDTNAFGVPADNRFLDGNVNTFSFNNDKVTEQTNVELRYATDFEGPVEVAVGGVYWQEEVENRSKSITGQASGSHCFWNSSTGFISLPPPTGCPGYTETVIAPYQQAAAPFRTPNPADRDTEHYSIYSHIDIELTPTLTLGLEGRYNVEEVTVYGPIFYDPEASGGPGGINPCGIFFRPCEDFDSWAGTGNWFSDAYFPYELDGSFDEALLATIPDLCRQQDPAGVMRAILDSPFQVERNPDGTPVVVDDGGGNPVPVPIIDPATGRVVLNPEGTDLFNSWCVDSLRDKDSWFIPKVILDWKASEDALIYFSWGKSQKPGGFSLLTVGSSGLDRELTEFKPEKMTVWELGANTEWFDRTVRVNGAFFFQDFTDKQALTSALGNDGRLVSKIENAGAAEVWGAEVDITWRPEASFVAGNWTVRAGYTWLDTEYTDFRVLSGSAVRAADAGNCTPVSSIPGGPLDLCELNYSGNELENSTPGSFAGSLRYDRPLTGELDLFVAADVQWTDRRYTDITNNAFADDYWNADLQLGLQSTNWEVLAYVTNLFDDDTVRSSGGGPGLGCCFVLGSGIDIADPPASPAAKDIVMVDLPLFNTAFLPPPRVIGLRATYRFGTAP